MSAITLAGASRQTVELDGHSVSYQQIGTGPNLVFVHGWPLNGNTWRNVVPHLPGCTSYVIDLPGAGGSNGPREHALTIRNHVDSVVQFIDALALKDVVVVAQDSGGMIARFAAEKRPGAVRGLVLVGTEIPGQHSMLVRLFKFLGKLPGAKAMFRFSMGNRLIARSPLILGGTVHDRSLLDGEFRDNLLHPILADDDTMDAVTEMIRKFSFADIDALADVHPKLTMPVLLVFGEDDRFFPIDHARAMAKQFGGPTTFVAVPDAKLLVHEEHPELLAQKIEHFVADAVAVD